MNAVTTRLIRPVGLPASDRPTPQADNKVGAEITSGSHEQLKSASVHEVDGNQPSEPSQLSLHLYSPGDDSRIIPNALGGTLDLKG